VAPPSRAPKLSNYYLNGEHQSIHWPKPNGWDTTSRRRHGWFSSGKFLFFCIVKIARHFLIRQRNILITLFF
jgi:hypothetical protein